MIQGTTIPLSFQLSKQLDMEQVDLTTLYASISQSSLSIEKSGDGLTIDDHIVTINLTQEESLRLQEGRAEVQFNWLYKNGLRDATETVVINVGKNLLVRVIK